MKLKNRSTEKEIMDDLDIHGPVIDQTLKELNTINTWLGGNQISLHAIKKLVQGKSSFHLTDLGCGGGDIMMEIAEWARKKKIKATFTGIDANPHIVTYAQQNCKAYPEISILQQDIFSSTYAEHQTDIVHCCLFLHHFNEEELIRLFKLFKKQSTVGIVVNDLQRHPMAFYSIRLLTKWFSKSFMVRNDAAVSVARGFKKDELFDILSKAAISNFSIQWKWAFRWRVIVDLKK